MDREIKFRAWIENERNMVEVERLWFPLQPFPMRSVECDEGRGFGIDEVVLMQYTGLHDKNGAEIYEGDVVKEGNSIGEIRYHNGRFFIRWECNRDFWSESLEFHFGACEVVGNIHENPELLEER